MKKSLIAAILASSALTAPVLAQDLTRIGAVTVGGEVTGLFLQGGDMFFNVQHPADDLGTDWGKATIGVVANADFAGATALPVPEGDAMKMATTSIGTYQPLIHEGEFDLIGRISGANGDITTSNDPDFNAFVPTGDAEGYLFTNWEDRPGGMSRVKMSRAADGTWTVNPEGAMMLDFTGVQGTWVNCFGTLSPWGTPLSSEELYWDETATWNNPNDEYIADLDGLTAYLGHYPNPYNYGHIVEITDPAGTATPVKRFAMGRFSHENAVVMPDQKTVYLSDDGTDVVFFKFVADTAGDLSAGTLHAAKMTQDDAQGFAVEWIELAHAAEADIAGWIAEYDGIGQDDYAEGANSYITDEDVAAWAAGTAADDRVAFLESRKAAAAKGATAEFRKMEGVNVNFEAIAAGHSYAWMAMSEVAKGMSDGEGDVRVDENKCGIVYRLTLDPAFNITEMTPAVVGGPFDKNAEANGCSVDNIANPDNILPLPNGDVVIGEDTGLHENNMIWLYRPAAM